MPGRIAVIVAAVVLASGLYPARAADDKDISCKESGQYIGGIDRHWQLTITGPKEKKWDYTFTHAPAGAFEVTSRRAESMSCRAIWRSSPPRTRALA
jgi:hypothetical protein